MIGKLKGTIDSSHTDHIIIDVNGVGYLVFCSGKTLAKLAVGTSAALMIETHVREDHIHLFGFYSLEEKTTFTILQSVKGVGTKMALGILSGMNPDEISYALAMKDIAAFTKVSGVGKKLAERIVTELKDKFSADYITNAPMQLNSNIASSSILADAISALVSLGVNKADAHDRVSTILVQNKEVGINELIRLALKNN